ncbi:hypothetical protein CC156_003042 [Salmonella enterica subsp. enterica serovar Carrau]|nr:hypothetical protein [Salmonella enterica]EBU1210228.1 hypothetical protein [Salmonella enterica]ECT9469942.1 hypothetical protein [Salmonella enterica subsp. enterica serovar Carrau]EDR9731786.1 hypothetical protein [Salmonella enterica subsp. enterica serovar Carrau]
MWNPEENDNIEDAAISARCLQLRPSVEHGAVRIQFDPVINTTYGNPEFVVMSCRDNAFKVVEEHLG